MPVDVPLACEQVAADVSKVLSLGVLSLDGSLRHIRGIRPMANS